ncbi:MAG: hypothetical protein IT380_27810 [Myxococcales bacterium]|nr:hypothetical protein [Myxococcales bacterium]
MSIRWSLFVSAAAVLLLACPQENPNLCVQDCDGGATGGGTGGAGGGGAGGGGGTGGGGMVGGGGGAPDGGCVADWQCGPWEAADGGLATRRCQDFNACPGATPPAQGPLPIPALDLAFYKCNVQPVFDRGCSMFGCHGVVPNNPKGRLFGVYSRGRLRNDETVPQVPSCPIGPQTVNLMQEGSGTVMCVGWSRLTNAEWQRNFSGAKLWAVGLPSTADSELLQQPLAGSPFAHAGAKLFKDARDPQYVTIKAWLEGAQGGACDAGSN